MTDETIDLTGLPVEAITRLSLEPGDVLVLRTDYDFDGDEIVQIQSNAEAMLPEGTRVVLLTGGMRLEGIVSAAQAAAA